MTRKHKKRESEKKQKKRSDKPDSKKVAKSLDRKWEKVANLCLFSFIDGSGKEIFISNEDERAWFGKGQEKTFRDYPVFAPDSIVNRVAGKIGKARSSEEVLTAWIDGSYSFSDSRGCCAYAVFFQVGNRIAEYANTVYDGTGQYGATASELMAAIVAIKVAIAYGYSRIDLRHDYSGVAFFADDARVEPNRRSKMYWIFAQYNSFLQCARKHIDIAYTKVKGHSLDIGNEHADFLARTYSKRGRREINEKIRRDQRKVQQSSAQIDAFAERYGIDGLSFSIVESDMVRLGIRDAFGFSEVEYTAIGKFLHEVPTEEIMSQMLLNRKALAAKRRAIVEKLGYSPDDASDNTIVKHVLEWMYLACSGRGDEIPPAEVGSGKKDKKKRKKKAREAGDIE